MKSDIPVLIGVPEQAVTQRSRAEVSDEILL